MNRTAMNARAAMNLRRVANLGTRRIAIRHGQTLPIFPVLGYPKSGTTWLCHLLAESLALPFAQFAHLPVAMPSVVHGHWRYHRNLRNVTFTVRDGRDTMVSFYFYCKLQSEHGMKMTAFRSLFAPGDDINDVRTHLPRFIEYIFENPIGSRSSWPDYNDEWLGKPGVVSVKYEDLHANAVGELTRIAEAHGHPAPAWRIERAVQGQSMRRATGRAPGQEDRGSVIRKGIVGDWTNAFSDEARAVFADLAGRTLVQLGYESSTDWGAWGTHHETAADPQ